MARKPIVREYKPPFPWFGGKRWIASAVWQRLGQTRNYVEPFFGSGAMLFLCPFEHNTATVNDADGMIANFWRAVQDDPEQVAHYADWPVNENDLHARHAWLVGRKEKLQARLEGDPAFYDAKIAGWWAWGICCWIGSGFCSGKGPWQVRKLDGMRQLVHLGNAGQGVNRQLVHLGDAGRGVNRKRELLAYFQELSDRLRRVRVCCGDWKRVCTPTPTIKLGTTAVFLDPPYADTAERKSNLYTHDSLTVAHNVREWAIAHGDDPRFRIALCGYEGEHKMPRRWRVLAWKTAGGYASQGTAGSKNRHKERIWFSPHCFRVRERIAA